MSPRTKAQLESLKETRKEQIILSALQLFGDKGYQNTSISQIAKQAKLSKGLMYTYFESKEALLNEVVIYTFKDATEMGEEILQASKGKSPEEVFTIMVESFFEMLKEQKDLWKLTISLAVQTSVIPSVHNSILKIYDNLLRQLEVLFVLLKFKNPKKEAMLLGAIIDGISIQYILFGKEYPFDEIKEMIVTKYLTQKNA
jgi:AcrR family transcriptional regulator